MWVVARIFWVVARLLLRYYGWWLLYYGLYERPSNVSLWGFFTHFKSLMIRGLKILYYLLFDNILINCFLVQLFIKAILMFSSNGSVSLC